MYEQLFKRQEDIFKVIASQKRLEIIQLLTHGELSVSAMIEMLGVPQANVSQHLSLLRHAGIVTTRKEGKTIYYRLANPKIAQACSLVRQFLVEQKQLDDTKILDLKISSVYPLAKDPVCGMRLGVSEISDQASHQGQTYYFCAGGCKQKFTTHPTRYVKTKALAN